MLFCQKLRQQTASHDKYPIDPFQTITTLSLSPLEQCLHIHSQHLGDTNCRSHAGFSFSMFVILIQPTRNAGFLCDLRLCLAGLLAGRFQFLIHFLLSSRRFTIYLSCDHTITRCIYRVKTLFIGGYSYVSPRRIKALPKRIQDNPKTRRRNIRHCRARLAVV
nr:MAG TPA: hypothetical protein [Caudoviricetes sp.]